MKNSADLDTFCSLAWNHLQVLPGGDLRPCCRFLTEEVPENFRNGLSNISEARNSEFIEQLRQRMLRGERIQGCKKCYEEEDSKKTHSIRQLYNKAYGMAKKIDYNAPKLQFLEIATSNLCNLKCRICSPYFSSKWNEDADILSIPKYSPKKMKLASVFSEHLDDLELIKFTGGEPFLIADYSDFLAALVDRGLSHRIILNYSTNCSIQPSPKLVELWKKFKFVEVSVSLDGIGPVFEFGRFPLIWNTFDKNLNFLFDLRKSALLDLRIGARPSISIYNIFDTLNITDYWLHKISTYNVKHEKGLCWYNPTHVQVPSYFSIQNMPEKIKEQFKKLIEKRTYNDYVQTAHEHLVNYMCEKKMSDTEWSSFLEFNEKIDIKRKQNFFELFPIFNSSHNRL